MQEIQLKYFFLPIRLQVQSNPGGEHVIVLQPTILGTFEFMRLTISEAYQFAEFLETGAENASAVPIISGQVGEINVISVRKLGTIKIRVRFIVKRRDSITLAMLSIISKGGRKHQHSRPTISAEEARRFAVVLREANAI